MRHIGLRSACLVAVGCVVALSLAAPSMGREWSFGKVLKLDAELESYDGKKARLKLTSGDVWDVAIEKLGEEDRAYLKKTFPNGKQRAKNPTPTPAKTSPAKTSPAKTSPAKTTPAKTTPTKTTPAKTTPAKTNLGKAGAGKPAAAKTPSTRPAAATASDAKASDVHVELVSLTITKPMGASAGLVPGTHVTLLVSSPSKKLLRLDVDKTKIVCADDRANNLSKPAPGSEAPTDEEPLTLDIAPDGKSGTIVFDYPRTPTSKSTRIRLKGALHLVCGSDADSEGVIVPLTLIISLGL